MYSSFQLNNQGPNHFLCHRSSSPDVCLEWLYKEVGATCIEFVFSVQPEARPFFSGLRRRQLPLPPLSSRAQAGAGGQDSSCSSGRPALPLATIERLLALPRSGRGSKRSLYWLTWAARPIGREVTGRRLSGGCGGRKLD